MASSDLDFFLGHGVTDVPGSVETPTLFLSCLASNGMAFTVREAKCNNAFRSTSERNDSVGPTTYFIYYIRTLDFDSHFIDDLMR